MVAVSSGGDLQCGLLPNLNWGKFREEGSYGSSLPLSINIMTDMDLLKHNEAYKLTDCYFSSRLLLLWGPWERAAQAFLH